jgi:hypothetical protein
VKLACATEGSSIAYTTDAGEHPHWRLYSGPITLARDATLRVRACRLGYRDSPEVRESFRVSSSARQTPDR